MYKIYTTESDKNGLTKLNINQQMSNFIHVRMLLIL